MQSAEHHFIPIPARSLCVGMYLAGQRNNTGNGPATIQGLLDDATQVDQLKTSGLVFWIDARRSTIDATRLQNLSKGAPEPSHQAKPVTPITPPTTIPPLSSVLPPGFSDKPTGAQLKQAHRVRSEALNSIDHILSGRKTGISLDQPRVRQTVTSLLNTILESPAAMTAVMAFDPITTKHPTYVAHAFEISTLAVIIGYGQNYQFDTLYYLGMAGLIHDFVENDTFTHLHSCASPLVQNQERDRMRLTLDRTLSRINSKDMPREVSCIIREHHERSDGSGYPYGLKNDDIYWASQLIGLLDTYDILMKPSTKQPPLNPGAAISHLYRMAHRGSWDPSLVERMVAALGVYPVGSWVELSTGEIGIVMIANQDRLRPVIRITKNAQGVLLNKPKLMNLMSYPNCKIERARHDVSPIESHHSQPSQTLFED